ncbi:MAG TPA: hypothetical protein DEB35_11630 [Desulfuromonas sp.]|nr:hypothetical protein [Desulfuromonas sp.]
MDKFLFAGWLLRRLAEPPFFRRLFAGTLALLAGGAGLYAVVVFFIGWKGIFDHAADAMAGGIVYQLTFVVAIYAAVHAALLRARELDQATDGDNPVLAVAAAFCRATGEIWAFAAIPLGLGGGILNWFAGQGAQSIYKPVAGVIFFLKAAPASFANGGTIIVKGLVYGIAGLLLAYTVAELLKLAAARAK